MTSSNGIENSAMGAEVRIVPVQEEHYEGWLAQWQGYQRFYNVEIAAETTETSWRRMLDPAEPVYAAVAIGDKGVMGMVHWIFHRSTWTVGDYCYLQDLFVDPAQRASGVGRALIEHVYGAAQAAGASRVYWLTHESNTTAMKLYDRIADKPGFIQYRKAMPPK